MIQYVYTKWVMIMNDYIKLKEILENYYNFNIDIINKNEESTDGNVYMMKTKQDKYVVKIYSDLQHTTSIINLHKYLYDNNFYIPQVIETIDKKFFIKFNQKYIVVFSFLEGTQIGKLTDEELNDTLVIRIAQELRRLHDITNNKNLGFPIIGIFNKQNRKSILHFDLTKQNIFMTDTKIGFIDFDDAKYGDAVTDLSIILALLFVSKKRGIVQDKIELFINTYYADDYKLKQDELKLIKEYTCDWVDYLLETNCFDTSLQESFIYKKDIIKENL